MGVITVDTMNSYFKVHPGEQQEIEDQFKPGFVQETVEEFVFC